MRWLVLALALAGAGLSPAAAEEVDVELVLAADGSGSIDDEELRLQRDGYADAITSPEVLAAITGNTVGAIAIAYMEWGGPQSQHIIVDWHVVRDAASAAIFAQELRTRPRAARGYNSISNAIDFSVAMIERNAHAAPKRVIDVSGDGPNIGGRLIEDARDEAVARNVTINALAIRRGGSSVAWGASELGMPLEEYYRNNVIGGPGAFVEIADETRSFAAAVRAKLVQEIAQRAWPVRAAAAAQ
jgi:hypothetical protein